MKGKEKKKGKNKKPKTKNMFENVPLVEQI